MEIKVIVIINITRFTITEANIQQTMDMFAYGINTNRSDVYLSTFTDDAFLRPAVVDAVIGKKGKIHLWFD